MPITISLTGTPGGECVMIDAFPDHCPQCGAFGEQKIQSMLPTVAVARENSTRRSLWFTMACPRNVCRRPFFAVYEQAEPSAPYAPDYRLSFLTPLRPAEQQRDSNIEAISRDFYRILDQAFAAEEYGLNLIAGMGYRKVLEFLAKDYVVSQSRSALQVAKQSGDVARADELSTEIEVTLNRPLAQIIAMIPHDLTKQAAERAAWLGNDETHYTRVWTKHDIDDLKTLLHIVMTFISYEATAKKLVADMGRKNAP